MNISFKLDHTVTDSHVKRVTQAYLDIGWDVYDACCCSHALADRPVMSLSDIGALARQKCSFDTPEWLLQTAVRRGGTPGTGKLDTRGIGFSASSIACPWSEHPVEVRRFDAEEFDGGHDPDSITDAERLLEEELRSLCSAASPQWATLAPGRAPSLPELRVYAPPSYVDLRWLYLSNASFQESTILQLDRALDIVQWPSGWLLKTASPFAPPEHRDAIAEHHLWRALSVWSWSQRPLEHPPRRL